MNKILFFFISLLFINQAYADNVFSGNKEKLLSNDKFESCKLIFKKSNNNADQLHYRLVFSNNGSNPIKQYSLFFFDIILHSKEGKTYLIKNQEFEKLPDNFSDDESIEKVNSENQSTGYAPSELSSPQEVVINPDGKIVGIGDVTDIASIEALNTNQIVDVVIKVRNIDGESSYKLK